IAGKMSKSGTIGYVGAFPIPEVVAGINSYFLGAQSVNPNVKIKIVWVNSWYDPAKEADAAKALLDQGVDVLAQHTDSPAPLQTAEARGKMGFGQASDMERFAPKAQLTAIIDDWAPYYVARAKAALDGSWKSGDVWGGLDSGMVMMAPYKNMPEDVKKMAEETEKAIKSGQLNPFKCPLAKQDGAAVECKGTNALSDEQILSMNFYVKGIDDKLPQ
ncbi:MAG TPA: BMP family ABC transporter substrate-binding protein, partial [Beijerinckiaceae bacterium]|nr:BMP family ABC transporter substrate-binding protein [Beijerinckiaceae bacterium]